MSKPRLALYCDAPGWAQCHFSRQLARLAEGWGWDSIVTAGMFPNATGSFFYSPCRGAAENPIVATARRRSTGLWSHCSYGGWFTDDPLDEAALPSVPFHATNLYLYHLLKGRVPYLPAGVDTDMFRPATAEEREGPGPGSRDHRLVVGWTGSLAYNAPIKRLLDLIVPAVRGAGSDGPLAAQRVCFRPLPVWDSRDARPPELVAEYLRGIDVFLWGSLSEGSSMSVLEAAAAGCVIVSTPCGNAPELVMDPRLLVGWDASEMTRLLCMLNDDRKWLRDLSERTRAVVSKRFSWQTAPALRDAWKCWLTGEGPLPSPAELMPHVQQTGLELLDTARRLRESARPRLVRGDFYAS